MKQEGIEKLEKKTTNRKMEKEKWWSWLIIRLEWVAKEPLNSTILVCCLNFEKDLVIWKFIHSKIRLSKDTCNIIHSHSHFYPPSCSTLLYSTYGFLSLLSTSLSVHLLPFFLFSIIFYVISTLLSWLLTSLCVFYLEFINLLVLYLFFTLFYTFSTQLSTYNVLICMITLYFSNCLSFFVNNLLIFYALFTCLCFLTTLYTFYFLFCFIFLHDYIYVRKIRKRRRRRRKKNIDLKYGENS